MILARYNARERAHRRACALAFGFQALSVSGLAHAECRVELVGPVSPAWTQAAVELEMKLEADHDAGSCASLAVEAHGGGARLTFETRDGRIVQRQIQDLIELIPTVESLSTEGPLSSAPLPATRPSRQRLLRLAPLLRAFRPSRCRRACHQNHTPSIRSTVLSWEYERARTI